MWVIVTQHCKYTDATELYTSRWFILRQFHLSVKKKNGIGFDEHLKIFPASLTLPNIAIKFIPDSSKTLSNDKRTSFVCIVVNS